MPTLYATGQGLAREMKRYQYTGRHPGGSAISGILSATDSDGLRLKLLERSIILESHQETLSKSDAISVRITGGKEVTRATRQLATLLESGLTIDEAIDSLTEEGGYRQLAIVFQAVLHRLHEGSTLAEALEDFPYLFDSTFVALIQAGESSGSLAEMMSRLAAHREQMEDLRRKFITSLAYPALVVTVSVAVLIAVFTFVIPVFQEMYAGFGAEMPTVTQAVVDFSEALKNNFFVISLVLITALFVLILGLRTTQGMRISHAGALRIPLIGSIWRKIAIARFSRTLGLLQREGADLLSAMSISVRVLGNRSLEEKLKPCEALLIEGRSLKDTLENSGIFPRALLRMVAAGERTGKLGTMLLNSARYLEKEIEAALSVITSIIEPVIILILGAVVGFVIVVMYLPLFDLINQIGP